jgi:hypothetical protein
MILSATCILWSTRRQVDALYAMPFRFMRRQGLACPRTGTFFVLSAHQAKAFLISSILTALKRLFDSTEEEA